jgi:hypothetical protein
MGGLRLSPFVLLLEMSLLQEWDETPFVLLHEMSLLQQWGEAETHCTAASNGIALPTASTYI